MFKPSIAALLSLIVAFVTFFIADEVIVYNRKVVYGIIVDGRRDGPHAISNQQKEGELIDSYNVKTCGLSDPDVEKNEFVNNAFPGSFPWLVSFKVRRQQDEKYAPFCMGSFISDKWILSAAHCFSDP